MLLVLSCVAVLILAAAPAASTGRTASWQSGAVIVATGSGLARALAHRTPKTIILEDGVYDHATPFEARAAHRVVARHPGLARLTAGLVVGGPGHAGGTQLHGLVLDVSDPAKTLHGAAVHVWGRGGANTSVTDCAFDGNGALAYGLYVLNPDGLVAERLSFRDFTDVALRASDNRTVPYGSPTPRIQSIADIVVDGVSRATPGESDGTAEAGLWIGHPVEAGVRRVVVRGTSWSGIETVNNSWDTTFADLEIDMTGPQSAAAVGVYLEHHSVGNTFERFTIRGATIGFKSEWADPARDGTAGAHDTVIREGTIDASGATSAETWGVYLDEGTVSTTVIGVVFRNQTVAAIAAYRTAGVNRFDGNDTTGLLPGAATYSTAHLSAVR